MIRQQWALIAVLCGVVLSATGCQGGDDSVSDTTRTYVISNLSIPPVSGTNAAVGFNLDGVDSTGACATPPCTCVEDVRDFVSVDDPNQTGIDNALSTLVPNIETLLLDGTPFDERLAQRITEGNLLILLQVSDVDSYQDDDEVTVQFFLGAVPEGSTLAVEGSTIAANQVFDATSLGGQITGNIVNGRLRFNAPEITIPIHVDNFMLDLRLRSATLEASITDTRLIGGTFGGTVNIEDVANAVEGSMPGRREAVLSVLGQNADMAPSAEDMTMCTGLSAGIRFNAISAEISE